MFEDNRMSDQTQLDRKELKLWNPSAFLVGILDGASKIDMPRTFSLFMFPLLIRSNEWCLLSVK